ncbi:MAG TPA: hypothetical protein VMK66_00070, partial [Myxococcales bacterium]|nr:hypothetical protein [Myxococcales bacterium]
MNPRTGSRAAAGGVLVLVGALLAGASFFLPYVRLLRLFGASLTLTGPRIGGALWLVPAAAAAVLLARFAIPARRPRLRALLAAAAALVGLLVVLGVVLKLHQRTQLLFLGVSAAGMGVRP